MEFHECALEAGQLATHLQKHDQGGRSIDCASSIGQVKRKKDSRNEVVKPMCLTSSRGSKWCVYVQSR